jgi:hypothetical protein
VGGHAWLAGSFLGDLQVGGCRALRAYGEVRANLATAVLGASPLSRAASEALLRVPDWRILARIGLGQKAENRLLIAHSDGPIRQ